MKNKISIIGAMGRTGQKITKYFLENIDSNLFEISNLVVSNKNELIGSDICQILNIDVKKKYYLSSDIYNAIDNSDIIIDFSIENIMIEIIDIYFKKYKFNNKKFICGVTPFSINKAKNFNQFIENNLLFYSANMSILIGLISKFLDENSNFLLNNFDISIHEIHHIHKKDKISGTSNMLKNALLKNQKDKDIQLSSSRLSEIFGIHDMFFANKMEKFNIHHQILDRDIFANNLLLIIKWIIESGKINGFYGMNDFIDDYKKNI